MLCYFDILYVIFDILYVILLYYMLYLSDYMLYVLYRETEPADICRKVPRRFPEARLRIVANGPRRCEIFNVVFVILYVVSVRVCVIFAIIYILYLLY